MPIEIENNIEPPKKLKTLKLALSESDLDYDPGVWVSVNGVLRLLITGNDVKVYPGNRGSIASQLIQFDNS